MMPTAANDRAETYTSQNDFLLCNILLGYRISLNKRLPSNITCFIISAPLNKRPPPFLPVMQKYFLKKKTHEKMPC